MLVKSSPRENSNLVDSRKSRVVEDVNVVLTPDIVMATLARISTRNANSLALSFVSPRNALANGLRRRTPSKEDVVVSPDVAKRRNAKQLVKLVVG